MGGVFFSFLFHFHDDDNDDDDDDDDDNNDNIGNGTISWRRRTRPVEGTGTGLHPSVSKSLINDPWRARRGKGDRAGEGHVERFGEIARLLARSSRYTHFIGIHHGKDTQGRH